MAVILVIDDDPNIRQVIGFALRDEGHQVGEAPDGNAALALIEAQHPDLILLDMKMPIMDGWEFVRRYRERHGHRAPILVVTAATDAARRAAEVAAEDYLPKPFDLDALVERVAALVSGPRTAGQ
jgi:DNA-binding response OmpR family regulator